MESKSRIHQITVSLQDFVSNIGNGLMYKHSKDLGYLLSKKRATGMGALTLCSIGATTASLSLFTNNVYSNHIYGHLITVFYVGVFILIAYLGNLPGTKKVAMFLRTSLLLILTGVISYTGEFISVLPRVSYEISQAGLQTSKQSFQPLDQFSQKYEQVLDSLHGKIAETRGRLQTVLTQSGTANPAEKTASLQAQRKAIEDQLVFLESELHDTRQRYEERQNDLQSRAQNEQKQATAPVIALDVDRAMKKLEHHPDYAESYERITMLLLILAFVSEGLYNAMKLTEPKCAYAQWLEDMDTDQKRINASKRKLLHARIRSYEDLIQVATKNRDFSGLKVLAEALEELKNETFEEKGASHGA